MHVMSPLASSTVMEAWLACVTSELILLALQPSCGGSVWRSLQALRTDGMRRLRALTMRLRLEQDEPSRPYPRPCVLPPALRFADRLEHLVLDVLATDDARAARSRPLDRDRAGNAWTSGATWRGCRTSAACTSSRASPSSRTTDRTTAPSTGRRCRCCRW